MLDFMSSPILCLLICLTLWSYNSTVRGPYLVFHSLSCWWLNLPYKYIFTSCALNHVHLKITCWSPKSQQLWLYLETVHFERWFELNEALIQSDWTPYKERKFGHTQEHQRFTHKNHVRTQGAIYKPRNWTCPHLSLGLGPLKWRH
jgi:hypothetical protein